MRSLESASKKLKLFPDERINLKSNKTFSRHGGLRSALKKPMKESSDSRNVSFSEHVYEKEILLSMHVYRCVCSLWALSVHIE